MPCLIEYLSPLEKKCTYDAETYAEKKARHDAKVAGLKQALAILNNEVALIQRSSAHLQGFLDLLHLLFCIFCICLAWLKQGEAVRQVADPWMACCLRGPRLGKDKGKDQDKDKDTGDKDKELFTGKTTKPRMTTLQMSPLALLLVVCQCFPLAHRLSHRLRPPCGVG